MNRKKMVYANDTQQAFLASLARIKTALMGRGSGKTNLIGKVIACLFLYMPRTRYALVGQTYVSLDLVTMSEIRESLEQAGIYEYHPKSMPFGHYVIGIQPPTNWAKPYKKIGRKGHQYCMSFINGLVIQLVSQDNSETSRGLNLDGSLVDERGSIKTSVLNQVVYPTIRANTDKAISKSHLHHIQYEFGSAPWTAEGQEMYKVEENYLAEIEHIKKLSRGELLKYKPNFLWLESTCLDNPFTGQRYWDRMKQTLESLEFDIEIANMRLSSLPNGFYHAFSTKKHCYLPQDCYQYDEEKGIHAYLPNDYVKSKPLEITLDFNAEICWNIVSQTVGLEDRIINSKYVKPNLTTADKSILVQGAEWFTETYATHPDKIVYLYGDPGGNSRSASTSAVNLPFFNTYTDVLIKAGWMVNRRELTSYPKHIDKYRLVNYILSEENIRIPKQRINEYAGNNKALIIALQSIGVKQGSDLFEKDKSSERNKRSREYASDSTDALDYRLWAKYRKFLPGRTVHSSSSILL